MSSKTMPLCPECGAQWVNFFDMGMTLLGFHSPPGHNHDDNCVCAIYECANKHTRKVSLRRRCDRCSWVGKETCFCHPDPKLDEWPVFEAETSLPKIDRRHRLESAATPLA